MKDKLVSIAVVIFFAVSLLSNEIYAIQQGPDCVVVVQNATGSSFIGLCVDARVPRQFYA